MSKVRPLLRVACKEPVLSSVGRSGSVWFMLLCAETPWQIVSSLAALCQAKKYGVKLLQVV